MDNCYHYFHYFLKKKSDPLCTSLLYRQTPRILVALYIYVYIWFPSLFQGNLILKQYRCYIYLKINRTIIRWGQTTLLPPNLSSGKREPGSLILFTTEPALERHVLFPPPIANQSFFTFWPITTTFPCILYRAIQIRVPCSNRPNHLLCFVLPCPLSCTVNLSAWFSIA